jgi:hypothetical protein
MTFEITKNAENLKDKINKTPQITFEVNGIDEYFSTGKVLRFPSFDEEPPLLFDDGLFFDTPIEDNSGYDYISLKESSKDIRQQLIPEKGGAGGVQNFKIGIVNKNKTLNTIFNDEVLGKECRVSLGFLGSTFPDDYIVIFDGYISSYSIKHGMYIFNISHPDNLKRQEILNLISTQSTIPLNDFQTNIPVESTSDFIIPTTAQEINFKSYIRINDELMKLTQTNTATEFQNVLRNQLKTTASSHDDNSELQSFYRLEGKPIDLALKLMLSGTGNYADDISIDRFVTDSDGNSIRNAVYFNFNIDYNFNITEGDYCTITGATNTENNVTDRLITEVVIERTRAYIILDDPLLVSENITSAVISFKSQFNTLPVGLGMKPRNVDIDGILELESLIGGSSPDIDIYIKDEIKAKEFIEKELFKPCSLFFLPRKGRTSIYAALPPFNVGQSIVIDETNITNIDSLQVARSTNKNFYNAIAYKFEESSIEDKFKSGTIILNNESTENIPVGNKQLVIEAKGLRENAETRTAIFQRAQRLLDKYSNGPQYIDNIRVLYKDGYQIEIGDIIVFGSDNLQLPNGDSDVFLPTLMEVTDKKLSIQSGRVEISVINSGYGINGRFPVVSASSFIESQNDTKKIILKTSQSTTAVQLETDRWQEFIGRKVKIRDVNFTKEQVLTIDNLGEGNQNAIKFIEDITISINNGDVIELPDYDDAESYHKASYGYLNPTVNVDVVTDTSTIEADPTNLFVDAYIEVHSPDYSNISQEVQISNIVGNVITFSEPLNYLPSTGDKIDLIGFKSDKGLPYRYI